VDLVQTIDLNRKSGIIHIVNRDGRRGAVFFREGRVIDAEVGRLSGAEAMYRLFSWSDGRFEVDFKPIRVQMSSTCRRSAAHGGNAAARRMDRLLEKLPALDSAVEVDFRVLADQLADLPDEMNGILRLCDGNRSLLAVIDDSDYPDLEALTVASKLLTKASSTPASRPPAQRGGAWGRTGAAGWGRERGGSRAGRGASAAPRSVAQAETGRFTDTLDGRETGLHPRRAGERRNAKPARTHRAFSLHAPPFSVDTPCPRVGAGKSRFSGTRRRATP